MIKKIVLAGVAGVAALAVGGAHAQAYMGAGLTVSNLGVNCSGTQVCHTDSGGAKFYGGYVPRDGGLGGELSYLYLGSVKSSAYQGTTLVSTDTRASAIAAAMVLRANLTNRFFLHAKLGLARVSMTAQPRATALLLSDESESTTQPYLSFGAEFGFVENVKLTAFIDKTKGKIHGEGASMHMAGLGVEFLF